MGLSFIQKLPSGTKALFKTLWPQIQTVQLNTWRWIPLTLELNPFVKEHSPIHMELATKRNLLCWVTQLTELVEEIWTCSKVRNCVSREDLRHIMKFQNLEMWHATPLKPNVAQQNKNSNSAHHQINVLSMSSNFFKQVNNSIHKNYKLKLAPTIQIGICTKSTTLHRKHLYQNFT